MKLWLGDWPGACLTCLWLVGGSVTRPRWGRVIRFRPWNVMARRERLSMSRTGQRRRFLIVQGQVCAEFAAQRHAAGWAGASVLGKVDGVQRGQFGYFARADIDALAVVVRQLTTGWVAADPAAVVLWVRGVVMPGVGRLAPLRWCSRR